MKTRHSVKSLCPGARRLQLRLAGILEVKRLRSAALALLLGLNACAAATVAQPSQPETVGQLAPAAYGHSVSAPVHHDAPPEFAGVVGSDDDQVGETITTVTRRADAGSDDAAELPAVAPKSDGIQMGEVR